MAEKSLTAAAESGDRRQALETLRDTLASTIEAAEPREVAALARQLTIVLEQLDSLPATAAEVTPLDELSVARTARRGAAAKAV